MLGNAICSNMPQPGEGVLSQPTPASAAHHGHCYTTPASDLPFSAPHGNGGAWWLSSRGGRAKAQSAQQAGFEGAEENTSESKGKSCTDQQSKQRNKGAQTLELMPTQ